jgi:hypothetical protein
MREIASFRMGGSWDLNEEGRKAGKRRPACVSRWAMGEGITFVPGKKTWMDEVVTRGAN